MHIELVDTHRNVRIVPTKDGGDPFDVMRDLMRHIPASAIAEGQAEFRADKEFIVAMQEHEADAAFVPADKSQRRLVRFEDGRQAQYFAPTFAGIPINVIGG